MYLIDKVQDRQENPMLAVYPCDGLTVNRNG